MSVTPSAYLDTLADIALKAAREGKTISATGANGVSVGYTVFQGFEPQQVLELIDLLRAPCEEATVTAALAALAEIRPTVRAFSTDFSYLRNGGAL